VAMAKPQSAKNESVQACPSTDGDNSSSYDPHTQVREINLKKGF